LEEYGRIHSMLSDIWLSAEKRKAQTNELYSFGSDDIDFINGNVFSLAATTVDFEVNSRLYTFDVTAANTANGGNKYMGLTAASY
jgi:hypothetical protein